VADTAGTRIVLIRHGESRAMVDQVVGGHVGCKGLSDEGRRQAEALRDRLARTGELSDASALYASVLPRAIETAEIIAPALGGLDVVQDCGVCECHPSDEIDGMTWVDVRSRFGEPEDGSVYAEWAPGSETWAAFVVRVGTALSRLAAEHAGHTVVVASHGGVVDSSFRVFGHTPIHRAFKTYTVNTSITEWRLAPGEREWTLVRYNDFAHLMD
jgi:probable phosphoglycerate mutase